MVTYDGGLASMLGVEEVHTGPAGGLAVGTREREGRSQSFKVVHSLV